VAKKTTSANQHKNIEVDLEFPRAQKELQALENKELDQIEATIEKVKKMTWDQVYKTSSKTQKRGLNWEPIDGQQTTSGKSIASIRVSGKSRARVCRDGNFMKFISFHPDHDSAYDEDGGEEI
jgi:mRNA-degrading endonuclease RelE of RelBE toxin-antitoxin system